ncbi:HeH/LEM domain-containing protein [Halopseudomonas sp. SMJS2]|uniref:HeH/LEM domain-containing protein n=1 Tax=Halopseudomonas sp. SMJS2 TaxID=3041098 RepID=UPI002452D309|nr:HeH/LEM domain-containing protein [Halopseudomonas sp. SMJS2]WGK60513.1 HeH/LEM domain-containing protein [Halopseudomonas sp. SMJS2]
MKVIYTKTPGRERGVCYRTKYLGVIATATVVVIDGDFPGVAEAYERAGIQVGDTKPDGGQGESDPHKMGVADLKTWLTEQGIEFDATAKKAELQKLIPQQEDGDTKPDGTED